ncbi:hypothetical protein [Mucilaginibacter paludis]|uniref:Uncharacterized protein n=1 Tax=Mucilaginibacter paludis DSM 18603 TaxID=714943 RepID=H1YCA7_9SPHI|nr:hypothetical protein [Mucilaginibacter paludis]EHQ30098.1 hypothetical protein Mucpa_6040 [Mucilaginibacter paludis DSM 18603]
MENFDHVLIFKTDVKTDADKNALHRLLDNDSRINQWNLDMEDEDHVLRIESDCLNHQYIINLINVHGYHCCELT